MFVRQIYGARVGVVTSYRYVDNQGAPWNIATFDAPQFPDMKKVTARSVAYNNGVVTGDDSKLVQIDVDKFQVKNKRETVNLNSSTRYIVEYPGYKEPMVLKDQNDAEWPVYNITNESDGPIGYYVASEEVKKIPFSGTVIGPNSSLVDLYADLKFFVTRRNQAIGKESINEYTVAQPPVQSIDPLKWFNGLFAPGTAPEKAPGTTSDVKNYGSGIAIFALAGLGAFGLYKWFSSRS